MRGNEEELLRCWHRDSVVKVAKNPLPNKIRIQYNRTDQNWTEQNRVVEQ